MYMFRGNGPKSSWPVPESLDRSHKNNFYGTGPIKDDFYETGPKLEVISWDHYTPLSRPPFLS